MSPVVFSLPWDAGETLVLTQDGDDPCCRDHVGAAKNAWDFARTDAQPFDVRAPADGTIVQLKLSSHHGCPEPRCVDEANYVVLAHEDGTWTTMLHLASAPPSLRCGERVRAGGILGVAGSTGLASGVHLHVERDRAVPGAKSCACGADGLACAPGEAHFELFFPIDERPNLPLVFEEWPDSMAFGGRRVLIGPSRNEPILAGPAPRAPRGRRPGSRVRRTLVWLGLAAAIVALVLFVERRAGGVK